VSRPDPRIARLEKFFESYHCPAPHHTSEYLRAADSYRLDYRLLPAVSIRETLCGRTEKQQHNAWGVGMASGDWLLIARGTAENRLFEFQIEIVNRDVDKAG